MPKVILGQTARIESESGKMLRAFEKSLRMRMNEALRENGMTQKSVSIDVGLSRPTVNAMFKNPCRAEPKNLFKVLFVLGVKI